MPPPNDDVAHVSGVDIREWETCCFFGPSVNLVVALDVLSVLLGRCLGKLAVPWYPSHGDRIALCVGVDEVPQVAVGTLPVRLCLGPSHTRLVVEGQRVPCISQLGEHRRWLELGPIGRLWPRDAGNDDERPTSQGTPRPGVIPVISVADEFAAIAMPFVAAAGLVVGVRFVACHDTFGEAGLAHSVAMYFRDRDSSPTSGCWLRI